MLLNNYIWQPYLCRVCATISHSYTTMESGSEMVLVLLSKDMIKGAGHALYIDDDGGEDREQWGG